MTKDPGISDKKWLAGLLCIPVLALILIAVICIAESGKSVYPAEFCGELLSVREDSIEVDGYGLIPLADDCRGFFAFDGSGERPLTDLCVGSELEFKTADDVICEISETEDTKDLPVRVLLMSQDFSGCFHDHVSLRSDGIIGVSQNGSVYDIPEGETVTFYTDDEDLSGGRLIFTTEDGSGIMVTSFSRADGNPVYPGRLELIDTDEGLVLINETDMETYLTRVVPSEMAGYFDPEALKAQAVCARTYAWTQQRANRYPVYGAQMDDSTNFQVYNNVDEEPAATAAVFDTKGELILYDNDPIPAYYFSTSCGNTTDGSVWGMDPEDTPYLKSVALQPGRRTFDWSDEDEFADFIKRRNVNSFDSDSAYFRWNLTLNSDILEQTFTDIGTVTDMKITRRGAGGVALEMLVTGDAGEQTVEGQYDIRRALCDPSLSLTLNDDSGVEGFQALPSAFVYVERSYTDDDGITYFRVYGGGYGHGAGMSQNGAQGMAKNGMDYREILTFFYNDVSIGPG